MRIHIFLEFAQAGRPFPLIRDPPAVLGSSGVACHPYSRLFFPVLREASRNTKYEKAMSKENE